MSKARDELANKYRDSINTMKYAPEHWKDDRGNIINYVSELEQQKAELIEILKPIKQIIDKYELYNELIIELIYDKLTEVTKTS